MPSQSSALYCRNPQCPQPRGPWLLRRWRPKGFWLNRKWYCSSECFEEGAAEEFSRIDLKSGQSRSIHHRLPLGLLMLSKGFISRQNMQEALQAQRESRKGRFGEWLLRFGNITEVQLTTALGMQWGCPVFHLTGSTGFGECAMMMPLYAMEMSRMLPVHFLAAVRKLYVAFSDRVDYSALRSIEQMLDCEAHPCVISQSEMKAAHGEIRRMERPSETVIDCPHDVHDLAREVREWAEANAAERIGAVACPECLWVRIEGPAVVGHLVFRFRDTRTSPTSPALQSHSSIEEPAYL